MKTFHLTLQNRAVLSGIAAFVIPIITYVISKKLSSTTKKLLIFACAAIMLYFTLLNRQPNSVNSIELTPFYSYRLIESSGVQLQILMNIFLFIPFGFLMALCCDKPFWLTIVLGCLFSVSIETMQYVFALGFCETDDVISNTLGTFIGCLYYRLVLLLSETLRRKRSEEI